MELPPPQNAPLRMLLVCPDQELQKLRAYEDQEDEDHQAKDPADELDGHGDLRESRGSRESSAYSGSTRPFFGPPGQSI